MDISESSKIERNPDIIFSEIDNETVMMDKDFESYFGLAEIGSRIWEELAKQQTVKSLCETLMQEYDVSYADCLNDVAELLSALQQQDMILVD